MADLRRRLRRIRERASSRLDHASARAALRRVRPAGGARAAVVLVRGYFGAGNLGDELLLAVLRSNLARRGLAVAAASFHPERTRREHGIEAFPRSASPRDAVRLLPRLRRARALLLGPGGILQSAGEPSPSLLAYALHAEAAERTGTPLGLLGVGAGPLSPSARRVAEGIAGRARALLLRDEASRALVAPGRGPADGVFVAPDLAFLHEDGAGRTDPPDGHDLGFAPIRLRNAPPAFAPADPSRWRREYARGLALASRGHAALRPALLHETEDGDELAALGPAFEAAGLHPAPPGAPNLDGVGAWLSSCEVAVVSRFHALVLALLWGRPAVTLAYHPKVVELARAAGLEAWTLPLPEVTAEALAARVEDARARRAEISTRMRAFAARCREEARAGWEAALDRLLGSPAP